MYKIKIVQKMGNQNEKQTLVYANYFGVHIRNAKGVKFHG